MANVLEFKATDPDIGLTSRTPVKGPESDLLNEFVKQFGDLGESRRDYALFYEPLLPTGYPDLVIVSYSPKSYESWNRERPKVGVLEMKVLHHLYYVKGSTSASIEQQLGIESRILLRTLERLLDAALVRRAKQLWVPKPLSTTYGIKNIKTIEAKISDWTGVFSQASMNRLFASESCVLSPVSKPSEQVVHNARSSGIGIYAMPNGMPVKIIQKPERFSGLPVSYASWLFNEWIGRRLFKQRSIV